MLWLTRALDILSRMLSGDDPKAALRAAAILLRMSGAGCAFRSAATANDGVAPHPLTDAVEAYINAPMPEPVSPGASDDALDDERADDDASAD